MSYQIKIEYTTGDSFGSSEEEELLEVEFNDIRLAEENLTRIKEHYDYFSEIDSCYRRSPKPPSKPSWFDDDTCQYSIVLKTDTGDLLIISCFWMGYFESLELIEVVTSNLPSYIFNVDKGGYMTLGYKQLEELTTKIRQDELQHELACTKEALAMCLAKLADAGLDAEILRCAKDQANWFMQFSEGGAATYDELCTKTDEAVRARDGVV